MPLLIQGKTNWKFLLIVVVLAVIVGGGILWCPLKEKQPDVSLSQNPSPECSKDEDCGEGEICLKGGCIVDETAYWQSYRNEEYGYEVKHPSDWVSLGASAGGFNIKSPLTGGKTSDRIESRIFQREGVESNQEYIDNLIKQSILPGYLELSSEKEVSINSIKGYEIIWKTKDPETNQFFDGPVNVFLETSAENKARFILIIFAGEASQDNPNLQIFYKILSTFSFLE